MESTDMNHPFSSDDAELEKMLSHPDGPPLPDDGFSLRVMATLPAAPLPRSTSFNKQRAILCTLGAFAGLAISWKYGLASLDFSVIMAQLSQTGSAIVSASSDPSLMAVSVIVLCSMIYAFLSGKDPNISDR
jgi:hypothetical protein